METRFQYLKRLYYPGYMGLLTEDYSKRSGVFGFMATEPPVFRAADYLNPRGAHIFISQGGICLVENVLVEEGFDMSVEDYRKLTAEGRLKIIELNQRFRREIGIGGNLVGRLDITGIRWGRMPMVKINFDIQNSSITGNLIGVLAPRPVNQTNSDIWRGNN
jgi:hypothetical protein